MGENHGGPAPQTGGGGDSGDPPTSGPERSHIEGSDLYRQYQQSNDLDTLFAAVRLFAEAVEGSDGHPDQPGYLSSLGDALRIVFEQTRNAAALDEAVALSRASVAATPDGHPRRSESLTGLARALYDLAEETGNPDVLREAAEIGRAAVEAAGDDGAEQIARHPVPAATPTPPPV